MDYVKFNNHPKGLNTSDCVVRAVSKAFNRDYLETRRELNRTKRELNFQSYKDTKFLYKYLENYERIILKAVKGKARVKGYDFTKMYPEGTFILKMAGHITVMIDGIIYDSWDCRYRSVYTAWRIN